MRKPNCKTLAARSIRRVVGTGPRMGVLVFALCSAVVGCGSDGHSDAVENASLQTAISSSGALNQLSWMVGYWSRIEGDSSSEEVWLPPRGGVMVGVHVDLFSSGRSFFEYLRVETRGDTLVYLASPRGREAVPFVASEIARGRAVFSNPSHDFPQHIGYTLIGEDSLRSEIWGSADGAKRRSSWTWVRSRL